MIVKNKEQADKIRQHLIELAYKAAMARDKFERELEKTKDRVDWNIICDLTGISHDCNASDWTC